MADLHVLQSDPIAFRSALLIDTDAGHQPLSVVLDDWQRADFTALDPGWKRVAGLPGSGSLRSWLERPRGHSKTGDIAVSVSWALFAARRKVSGVVAAADKDQAALIRDAIDRLCRGNPWLGKLLDVGRERVVNRHTGAELVILSSDVSSSYGLTPDFVVCDELTHWPRRELWDSLLSSAAKRAGCLLLVITNAGFADSWQWSTREAVRVDPAWHFSRLEGPRASWITADRRLDEQRRLLPSIAFARLWLNQWSSGSGDALEPSDIDAAVTLAGPATAAEPGWVYCGGLDLGLTRDASALCIVGKHVGHFETTEAAPEPRPVGTLAALLDCGILQETRLTETKKETYNPGSGRLILADLAVWQSHRGMSSGKVALEEIERGIVAVNSRFPLSCLAVDPWQAIYLSQRLQAQGIAIEATDFTPANFRSMASATLDAFTQRQIDLFGDQTLLADLRSLRVVERGYGFRLESPRTSGTGPGTAHGDTATALSLALHAASRITSGPPARLNRELIVWP